MRDVRGEMENGGKRTRALHVNAEYVDHVEVYPSFFNKDRICEQSVQCNAGRVDSNSVSIVPFLFLRSSQVLSSPPTYLLFCVSTSKLILFTPFDSIPFIVLFCFPLSLACPKPSLSYFHHSL